MKLMSKIICAAFAVSAVAPGLAAAQNTSTQAYWVNPNGIIWKNPYGLCWRAGYWTPAQAIAECDPDLVKKAEAPIPPMAAVEPPPPAPQVAPPAPPPPVVAPPAPAPAPRVVPNKITLAAEELFDFDKSVLKPGGKNTLDKLVNDLNGASYDVIVATGHTDRIGSATYNQKLSERRANAVKAYMISKGIPADRISSSGKGKTQPVTKPGECKGPVSKKLIACLQPDRRVEIEVSGTKGSTVLPQ